MDEYENEGRAIATEAFAGTVHIREASKRLSCARAHLQRRRTDSACKTGARGSALVAAFPDGIALVEAVLEDRPGHLEGLEQSADMAVTEL